MKPDNMTCPPVLDKVVVKCYRVQPFVSDAHREQYLFKLYEKYTSGLLTEEKPK